MKKSIFLLLILSSNIWAGLYDPKTIEAIEVIQSFANQNEISYEEGIQALLELLDLFSSLSSNLNKEGQMTLSEEEKERQLREWKTWYQQIHNKLFVLTHIARIRQQILNSPTSGKFEPDRQNWEREAYARIQTIKQNQMYSLKQVLDAISEESFDHSGHQFNNLSDLAKVNVEGSADSNGFTATGISSFSFSKKFSKVVSKGGSQSNPMSSSPYSHLYLDDDSLVNYLAALPSTHKIIEILRNSSKFTELKERVRKRREQIEQQKLIDYTSPFVSHYQEAKSFDTTQMDAPLPTNALPFLNALEIDNQIDDSIYRDLSTLYRNAPPSQGKSKACVGFALASDIEFELHKTHALEPAEFLSPWSVYANLRYLEEERQTPPCFELESLSKTIEQGLWDIDAGIRSFDGVTDNPFCLINHSGPKHFGFVSVNSIEEYTGEISFLLLKTLIDHNKPPIVEIHSDAMQEAEDWIKITPQGSSAHVLVVVGYGTNEIDPFTLRKGPYFIVRDSLGQQPIHYKVRAQNLLKYSFGLLKISQLERH